jgi:hypothetical protein
MKSLVSALLIFVSSSPAMADGIAALSCKGSHIKLEINQDIYVLTNIGVHDDYSYSAYFLDTKKTVLADGTILIQGFAHAGFFELQIKPTFDYSKVNDQKTSPGLLSYQHGALKGTNEKVACELQ